MLATHTQTHTCLDTGPCVLFPLATEVQYLRVLLDKTNSLLHSALSLSLPPIVLSLSHPLPPPPTTFPLSLYVFTLHHPFASVVLPSSNFILHHLSLLLALSLFLLPSLCPVRTLTRLSASLDTHHSPCSLFPLTAFVVGRKSNLYPPPTSPFSLRRPHLPNSPPLLSSSSPALPSALATTGPYTHTAHTFHRRKGQRVQLPQ